MDVTATTLVAEAPELQRLDAPIAVPVPVEGVDEIENPAKRRAVSAGTVSGEESGPTNPGKNRRENHNAVEKRRREAINTGIQELSDILVSSNIVYQTHKLNKGNVLNKGVEYIQYLQTVNAQMAERMKDSTVQQAEELQALAQELTELAQENEELKAELGAVQE